MSIFELLFVVGLVATLVALLVAAVKWVRGNRSGALAQLRILILCIAAYLVVDIVAALASSREVHKAGETQCFDDWCIRVTGAARRADGLVEVALQLSSRAKRVAQAERGTVAYLMDSQGHRYDPVADTAAVRFDTILNPGQSVTAVRSFRVPAERRDVGFVYEHEGFPIELFIIGQAGRWIHGPPITLLDIR